LFGSVAAVPTNVDSLFAYGSLAFDEVLVALLGRVPERRPWSLAGWRAARLVDRPYPGLVAHESGRTVGIALTGLTSAEWRTLDEYEGASYGRRAVGALEAGTVFTYVWLQDDLVEPADWDLDTFRRDLPRYVERLQPTRRP
jgi:gamma-glutamylcyclotransferase (GGCT)/AIG2-like uncharacterized protein YtfP